MTPTHLYSRSLRPVKRLTLLAILGLVTTIGVAWGIEGIPILRNIATSIQFSTTKQVIMRDDGLWIKTDARQCFRLERHWLHADRTMAEGTPEFRANAVTAALRVDATKVELIVDPTATVPKWGRLQDHHDVSMGWREHAIGAPLRCFWKWADPFGTGGHIALPDPHGTQWSEPGVSFRGLPYLPISVGLAANILFWGGFWWLTLLGLGAFRNRNRIRAGHCPNCNYDLRGIDTTTCPECGTASLPSPLGGAGEDVVEDDR